MRLRRKKYNELAPTILKIAILHKQLLKPCGCRIPIEEELAAAVFGNPSPFLGSFS